MSMWPVGGHLGDRASALLDGQLSENESERAWSHIAGCPSCRDVVEREGWIKRRLAGLTYDPAAASDGLKGSLRGAALCEPGAFFGPEHHRRNVTFAALGGSALGAAVMGVLALGAAPASAPTIDPTVAVTTPSPRPNTGSPVGSAGGSASDPSAGVSVSSGPRPTPALEMRRQ